MKGGDKARVHCPGDLDTGSGVNHYSDFGSNWVPEGLDMVYEFTVSECSFDPKLFKPVPLPEEREDGRELQDEEAVYF